jgi:thioredoxin reductase
VTPVNGTVRDIVGIEEDPTLVILTSVQITQAKLQTTLTTALRLTLSRTSKTNKMLNAGENVIGGGVSAMEEALYLSNSISKLKNSYQHQPNRTLQL